MKTILDNIKNNKEDNINNIEKDVSKFNKRRDLILLCIVIAFGIITLISFNYIVSLFPISMGLFIGTIGIISLVLLDKIIFIGDTIKEVANNAVAVSITYLSFTMFFICGFMFGNSYVSNSYGAENEASPTNTKQEILYNQENTKQDTVATGFDIELPIPEGNRKTNREQ